MLSFELNSNSSWFFFGKAKNVFLKKTCNGTFKINQFSSTVANECPTNNPILVEALSSVMMASLATESACHMPT
jgi:hypothetical protein